ncbi:hypothetical protein DL766_000037 [Monosporascus sp. MC13-8B]|uniref:Exonuclease V n=1 Tax=Monosporascus cannonballus TaxID=155416 RepID=A0ABY0HNE3_9PEZI|nr:hypothetical protein DL762_000406 [Monosporascus cannonballus]RYP01190.1 hypothetical protein DL763_000315 [Monosporascus cannonballus]RYP40236.1 hypothetical protein DL766_000037 [Monosporascus sp. MC13-8B]
MANIAPGSTPGLTPATVPPLGENCRQESDYGFDFSEGEEDIVNQLLEDLRNGNPAVATHSSYTTTPIPTPLLESLLASVEDPPFRPDLGASLTADLSEPSLPAQQKPQHHVAIQYAHPLEGVLSGAAKKPVPIHGNRTRDSNAFMSNQGASFNGISYPDLSHALMSLEPPQAAPITDSTLPDGAQHDTDTRSPLERFRSFPKKPLTVTDLSSGAWCELQYWYTLTRLPGGRKMRTAAMKGGTRVHQTLENQVHTTIQVNVTAKEEAFALRIWNFIQGLRTLRDTGMTRELEVWGMVHGEVANGVIDEVSYTCPNTAFEEELRDEWSQGEATQNSKPRSSIVDYFQPHRKRVYLTDIKTRGSTRLPFGAALRPARVQLFLYHRLLSDMASGKVDYPAIIARYGLSPQARFSDAFMEQIGDLHDEVFFDADSEPEGLPSTPRSPRYGPVTGYPGPSPDTFAHLAPPPDLLRYRSLEQLMPLVQSELEETFPQGADSIGELLAVQYRHREDGRIIGNNSFPNDPEALDGYLRRNLNWWRGGREAEGVPIEETYKCQSCEFAEICQWRKDREEEIILGRQRDR